MDHCGAGGALSRSPAKSLYRAVVPPHVQDTRKNAAPAHAHGLPRPFSCSWGQPRVALSVLTLFRVFAALRLQLGIFCCECVLAPFRRWQGWRWALSSERKRRCLRPPCSVEALTRVACLLVRYVTPPHCASLPLRISLATRLLAPGRGASAANPGCANLQHARTRTHAARSAMRTTMDTRTRLRVCAAHVL